MHKKKSFLEILFNGGIFFFIISFGIFSAFILVSLEDLQGINILKTYKPPVVTKILDVKGRIISEFYKERRKLVDYKDISKNIINAAISVEDRRFLNHYGVDLVRILKALFVNISNLKKEQGGSTITIQLSKLIFLDHKKTFERKIKELWYAFQIEKQYTKQEILNFYFNQINYGHGGFGVEAASQFYFGKSARDVNLGEASLLAGLPNSPYYYSPFRFPKNSQKRHRTVLISMVNNKTILPNTASSVYLDFWLNYKKKNRNIQETFGQLSQNNAPYFTEYIRNKIERDLDEGSVYEKGLVIHTTLNLDHQLEAQKQLWEQLENQKQFSDNLEKRLPKNTINSLFRSLSHHSKIIGLSKIDFERNILRKKIKTSLNKIYPSLDNLVLLNGIPPITVNYEYQKIEENDDPQGSLVSINPTTGGITAMVGGSTFNYNNQFNRAMNLKRQVGSVLKPFIYAVAIDQNIVRSSTILNDAPKFFNGYIPKNYSQRFLGEVTVRDALRKSINVLAVETLDMVGIDNMQRELSKIFRSFSAREIEERFPKNLTMALGSGAFSPFAIATAYAVLANDGLEVIPHTIRYITDENGTIIKNYEVELLSIKREQIISRSTAFIIKDIIKDVFEPGGTAYKPDLLPQFKHWESSFGKTGTTSNWKDSWFAGANSYLSTVVWFGYDDNKSLGKERTGGRVAAPVWIKYNTEVLREQPQEQNFLPNEVVSKRICVDCDGLAGPLCSPQRIRNEFYKIDNYPKEVCAATRNLEEEEKDFVGIVKKLNREDQGRTNQVNKFFNFIKSLNKKGDLPSKQSQREVTE